MRLSLRRRRPGAAGARSVWPPLPLAAQRDTHTDLVETRFFFFFLEKENKKRNPTKNRAQHASPTSSPPAPPQSGFWSRRGQLERSAGSPPAPPPRQPKPGGPRFCPAPAPQRRTGGPSPRICAPCPGLDHSRPSLLGGQLVLQFLQARGQLGQ